MINMDSSDGNRDTTQIESCDKALGCKNALQGPIASPLLLATLQW